MNEYHFSETASNLNVRSNTAYMSMENEHYSNDNNGRFFIGALSIYDGFEEELIEPDKPTRFDLILDVVDLVPKLSKVSTIISVCQFAADVYDYYNNDYIVQNKPISNENILSNLMLLMSQKSLQTTNYGRLIKDVLYVGDSETINYIMVEII